MFDLDLHTSTLIPLTSLVFFELIEGQALLGRPLTDNVVFTAISGFSTFKRAATLLPRSGTGEGEAFTGSDDSRLLNGLRQKTGFSISRLSLAQQTLYNALYRLILS